MFLLLFRMRASLVWLGRICSSRSVFFCCYCAALSLFLFLFFVCPVGRPDRSILQKLFNSSPIRPPTRPPTRPRCSSNRVLFCSCSAFLLLFCCSFAALLLSSICSCSALQQLFNLLNALPVLLSDRFRGSVLFAFPNQIQKRHQKDTFLICSAVLLLFCCFSAAFCCFCCSSAASLFVLLFSAVFCCFLMHCCVF